MPVALRFVIHIRNESYGPLEFVLRMYRIIIRHCGLLMLLLHNSRDGLACLTCVGGIQMCG